MKTAQNPPQHLPLAFPKSGVNMDTMTKLEDLVAGMRNNPKGVSFNDAVKVAKHYFGEPRNKGTSHFVFKMPWGGDPRVNLQPDGQYAKPYQVKQLLEAIDLLS